ncbi:MAG: hypothetical protein J6Z36_00755 [Clostridia bacterium]|nr:hypothetical protein [Clostridia bacterium]
MFSISNGNEFISFEIEKHFEISKTQPWECYFLNVKAKSGFISINRTVEAHKQAMVTLYEKLKKCYERVSGTVDAERFSFEEDFSLKIQFDNWGHVNVTAFLTDHFGNDCHLSFQTDQTFIPQTLNGMKETFGFVD